MLRSQRLFIRRFSQLKRSYSTTPPPTPPMPKRDPVRVSSNWSKYFERTGPISWKSLVATGLIVSGGLWYLQSEKKAMQQRIKDAESERQNATYGKPQVGGPFELTDAETGASVTDKTYHGKFMVIYFGFTNCPDVCPDELEKMSKAITMLDALPGVGEHIVPIFVSVDPKRDTPEVVKQYIKEFHPRFVGLTGTDEQVANVSKAYRIYISRGEESSEDDYLVDHSIFFFLMDPDGGFMDFFGRNSTADDIATMCTKSIRTWLKDKSAGRV